MEEEESVYRTCRLKAAARDKERFGSAEKAARRLQEARDKSEDPKLYAVSDRSVKDYESGKSVPNPETVELMAEVYGTPELKWLHCAYGCPLGRKIAPADRDMGDDDVRNTYFDLAGVFDLADEIEKKTHKVIEDSRLDDSEIPMVKDVLEKLDRITESAKELRVWAERQRAAKKRG